jgi:hypothetical protein
MGEMDDGFNLNSPAKEQSQWIFFTIYLLWAMRWSASNLMLLMSSGDEKRS